MKSHFSHVRATSEGGKGGRAPLINKNIPTLVGAINTMVKEVTPEEEELADRCGKCVGLMWEKKKKVRKVKVARGVCPTRHSKGETHGSADLALEEELVHGRAEDSTQQWTCPEDPVVVPFAVDDGWAKGAGRVDRTSIDASHAEVKDKVGHADGERGESTEVRTLGAARLVSGGHDDEDEGERAHDFSAEGGSVAGAIGDGVPGCNVGVGVQALCEGSSQDCSKTLACSVANATHGSDVFVDHVAEADRRVEMSSANTREGVGQDHHGCPKDPCEVNDRVESARGDAGGCEVQQQSRAYCLAGAVLKEAHVEVFAKVNAHAVGGGSIGLEVAHN